MLYKEDFQNFKDEILQGVQRCINTAFLHQKTFGEFKNKFQGKTIVLVGAGPTLNYFEPIKNTIYIGVNRTFLYNDISFNYLFAIDKNGLETDSESYIKAFIDYQGNNCLKFVGDQNCGKDMQIPEGKLCNEIRRYKTSANLTSSKFTLDIDSEPLGNFHSVSCQAMQFILYTNPLKIYLVGMDSNVATSGHFTDKIETKKHNSLIGNTLKCIEHWKNLKTFQEIHYPDTEIISVNPVGLKGIFKDLYTNRYLHSNDKLKFDKDFEEFINCPTKNYLQEMGFSKQFDDLINKLQNKKVIIYGTGILFQSIFNMFDLKKLDIIAVSDKKYSSEEEFYGYKAIPPKMIFDIGADCILVAVQEYERIIEDFKQKAPDDMEIIPLARKLEENE